MHSVISSFVFVAFVAVGSCDTIPPWLQKCQISDASCLKASAQKALPAFVEGIPELNVAPIDPLELGTVHVDLAGLKLKMSDMTHKGWKSSVFNEVKVDMAEKTLVIEIDADVTLRSKYVAGGMLLVLPISGDGDLKIKTKGVRFHLTMPFELEKGSDGKEYIHLKSVKNSFQVRTLAHFTLTNLFNGNKELSDIMHNFMNSNWKQIIQEFAGPVMDVTAEKFYQNLKAFFSKFPLEEIADQ